MAFQNVTMLQYSCSKGAAQDLGLTEFQLGGCTQQQR